MKVINIDKVIQLPSIKRNLLNHSSNISKQIDNIKINKINRISFSHKLDILSVNKRKKNYLKIFTPTKSRISNLYNNFDNLNIFNSFDSTNNYQPINKHYFLNSPKYLKQNFEFPLFNYNLIKSQQTKRRINNNFKQNSEIFKSSYYNNKEVNDNSKLIQEKNNNKISKKKKINIIKKLNDSEKYNYCFLSYAYNEYDNFPFRKSMEDFHCIKKNLLITNNNEIIFSYFAIFDGHSGKEISSYLSQNFHKILFSQLKTLNSFIDNENNINKIISLIKNSFISADKKIINEFSLKNEVGSTATIVLLIKLGTESFFSKYLICANIGDSRGYILSNTTLTQITKEHNCRNDEEVSRIKKSGGIVFNNRVYGTLMLTRSFGDKELKKHGVISEPDFFVKKIDEDDKFVIIASDGVWDTVKENDILELEKKSRNGDWAFSSDEFSKKIVRLAVDKGTMDNVSCIVIKLNK